jgi:hypothetical protein
VFRSDIRGQQRAPYGEEADIAAGEEVVFGAVLPLRGPPGDETDDGEVGGYDDPVDEGEGLDGGLGL